MEAIFADFERIVPDAMTHWQHPRFFAYFPSNASPASMLAEQLDVDLIVVGSHGRYGLALLMGSTANGVLHGASCDVLAVRVGS